MSVGLWFLVAILVLSCSRAEECRPPLGQSYRNIIAAPPYARFAEAPEQAEVMGYRSAQGYMNPHYQPNTYHHPGYRMSYSPQPMISHMPLHMPIYSPSIPASMDMMDPGVEMLGTPSYRSASAPIVSYLGPIPGRRPYVSERNPEMLRSYREPPQMMNAIWDQFRSPPPCKEPQGMMMNPLQDAARQKPPLLKASQDTQQENDDQTPKQTS